MALVTAGRPLPAERRLDAEGVCPICWGAYRSSVSRCPCVTRETRVSSLADWVDADAEEETDEIVGTS